MRPNRQTQFWRHRRLKCGFEISFSIISRTVRVREKILSTKLFVIKFRTKKLSFIFSCDAHTSRYRASKNVTYNKQGEVYHAARRTGVGIIEKSPEYNIAVAYKVNIITQRLRIVSIRNTKSN